MFTISHCFLFFVLYSFLGWVYESSFYTIQHKRFVNTGFLKGCICPIYGTGALLALLLLSDISNTVVLFFTAMIVCCTLEYFVSWLLEEMFGTRWWDYTNWPLNINGRVCILGALAFGTLIVLLIRCIHPTVEGFVMNLPISVIHILCTIFTVLIMCDMFYTLKHIDSSRDKLWFVKEQRNFFDGYNGCFSAKNKRLTLIKDEIIDVIRHYLK